MIYVNPYDAPESGDLPVPRSPVPFSWRESGRGTLLYSAPFPIAILLVNLCSGVPLWDCISTLLLPDSSFPLLACAAAYAIAFYWLIDRSRRLHGWVHLASGFIGQLLAMFAMPFSEPFETSIMAMFPDLPRGMLSRMIVMMGVSIVSVCTLSIAVYCLPQLTAENRFTKTTPN